MMTFSSIILDCTVSIAAGLITYQIIKKSNTDKRFLLPPHKSLFNSLKPFLTPLKLFLNKLGCQIFGVYLREFVIVGMTIVFPLCIISLGVLKLLENVLSTNNLELSMWRSLPLFALSIIAFVSMHYIYRRDKMIG